MFRVHIPLMTALDPCYVFLCWVIHILFRNIIRLFLSQRMAPLHLKVIFINVYVLCLIFTSHQKLGSYGHGTLVWSLVRGIGWVWGSNPWPIIYKARHLSTTYTNKKLKYIYPEVLIIEIPYLTLLMKREQRYTKTRSFDWIKINIILHLTAKTLTIKNPVISWSLWHLDV